MGTPYSAHDSNDRGTYLDVGEVGRVESAGRNRGKVKALTHDNAVRPLDGGHPALILACSQDVRHKFVTAVSKCAVTSVSALDKRGPQLAF